MSKKMTRGEMNDLFFKDIDELTDEDKVKLKPLVERGFVPLCDWHNVEKKILMHDHAKRLGKLFEEESE